MNVLIISDIHANLTALEAVLADAEGKYEAVWCLGDLVDYGPDPNECVERVRQLPGLQCIRGNHDAAVLDEIDVNSFNRDARRSVYWTRKQLDGATYDFLDSLPERLVIGDITLVHGSPREPVWEYILDRHTATVNFRYIDTPFCLVGHTHLPVVYALRNNARLAEKIIPLAGDSLTLTPRMILNPGSIGQPRDQDPRACYALLDTDRLEWEFRRVEYDIWDVQQRMRAAGLPERNILRLETGW